MPNTNNICEHTYTVFHHIKISQRERRTNLGPREKKAFESNDVPSHGSLLGLITDYTMVTVQQTMGHMVFAHVQYVK